MNDPLPAIAALLTELERLKLVQPWVAHAGA